MSSAAASLALQHDALLPRPPGGNGPGAALALLVHAGLVLALTTAVDWRTRTPDVVSAELWASVPQMAAPAPVVAPPPPLPPAPAVARVPPVQPDADIAVERARQRKTDADRKLADERAEAERKRADDTQRAEDEKKRLADEKTRKAEDERKQREQEEREARADEERLARQREDNLRRMMGQAGGAAGNAGGTGTATQNAAPSAAYTGRLIARIRPNIVYTGHVPASATAEVEVRAAAGGSIISRRLLKSSGYKEWDDAVLRAIDRTPSLPRDTDGRVPDQVTITFRRD